MTVIDCKLLLTSNESDHDAHKNRLNARWRNCNVSRAWAASARHVGGFREGAETPHNPALQAPIAAVRTLLDPGRSPQLPLQIRRI